MALNDDIAFLARQPLLSLMDRDALRLVAFAAESRTLRAGDVLFRRGEGSDGAFLVVSGAVALSRDDDGRPAEEIAGPGALIGELALFASLAESPDSAAALAHAIEERLTEFTGELASVGMSLRAIDWR